MWPTRNGRKGETILEFLGKKSVKNFVKTLLIKFFKVPFLAIWPLDGGASGRFLTLQVDFKVSFQMLRYTFILTLNSYRDGSPVFTHSRDEGEW